MRGGRVRLTFTDWNYMTTEITFSDLQRACIKADQRNDKSEAARLRAEMREYGSRYVDQRSPKEQAAAQARDNDVRALEAAKNHRAWLENASNSPANKKLALKRQDQIIAELEKRVAGAK